MTYFGGAILPNKGTVPTHIAILSRVPGDLEWKESVQYDAHGRGKVISHIQATAPGRLRVEVPRAGFVGPSGLECGESAPGARPVWIWDVDVA